MIIPLRVRCSQNEAEDDQARQRVLDAGDVEVDELVERPRPGDVLRDAAVVGEHLVGEDDRDRDRDKRLAQVLTLVPAQEELLHEQADPGDHGDRGQRREHPLPEAHLSAGQAEARVAADHVALQAQRDVPAEEEEGAVGHVDDAHEPEDQREAAGHDEVQRRRGEPVEQRDEEVLGVVDRGAEARPGGDEQHPDDREDHEGEQDGTTEMPQRPVCTEPRHAGRP
jgi:hypothetical protein